MIEVPSNRVNEAKEELWKAIERRSDELYEIVAELVRHPSVLGNEAGAQEAVAAHMRAAGMETELWELDDAVLELPNAGVSGVPFSGRPNVTGKRRGGGSGHSLIFNGHIDVVSPEPVEQWSHDPWGAEVVDQKMYGRGAYDMKSGVALNLFLPRLLNDLGIDLGGDLTVHSVIEEECTGNGSLAASLRDQADACLVTEPHFDSYCAAHIGVAWFRVQVEGRSAHAGWAWKGVNAIVKTVPIIQALSELDAELNAAIHPVWEGINHPINLNMGVIQGGDWPSTVPGACELHCRVGFFPDMTLEELRAKIEAAIDSAADSDDWLREHRPSVTYDGFQTNGVILPDDAAFLPVLIDAYHEVTGGTMEARVGTAVNDMRYYIFDGTPATCFGAAGGNGHAADEWLDLAPMAPAAKTIGAFMLEWCGVA
jgi:acetylornithine deacetylase